MIESFKQMTYIFSEDMKAHGVKSLFIIFLPGDKANIVQYQFYMRFLEFSSKYKALFLLTLVFKYLYIKKGEQLGFSIPINTFGSGLWIVHKGTIVINSEARIGRNCRIHVCVNIGKSPIGNGNAPVIGDNCYIGPGVKIFGDIEIGSGSMIGANAVVNKSFPGGGKIIGVPARRV
ncbi:serine O-acetyltransferase [Vibrio fluvialis]|uniref:serine O-acetyltransferase n=1 Tax=Vibrio fluvialis TaxID=676 RepID=UPI00192A7E0A|nr:serine acetyltransferase [Vibrio fluvialis]MBL4305217.1 serine acetyltransferase [Vibrio fluvialis]